MTTYYCDITYVNDDTCQACSCQKCSKSRVTMLTILERDMKEIYENDDFFVDFTHLDWLDMSGRLINGKIPDSIRHISQLTTLNLSSNKITDLPDWFRYCYKLSDINLSYNKLTSLPDWFRDCKKICALDISYNNITNLPDWIGDFKELVFQKNILHLHIQILRIFNRNFQS